MCPWGEWDTLQKACDLGPVSPYFSLHLSNVAECTVCLRHPSPRIPLCNL